MERKHYERPVYNEVFLRNEEVESEARFAPEVVSRWMRLWALFVDWGINITGIGFIANIIFLLIKKRTLWYKILGIELQDEYWNIIESGVKGWKSLLIYFHRLLYIGVLPIGLIAAIWLRMAEETGELNLRYILMWVLIVPCVLWCLFLLIQGLFAWTPNWLEKPLWIRRVQAKKPTKWLWILCVLVFFSLRIVSKIVSMEQRNIDADQDMVTQQEDYTVLQNLLTEHQCPMSVEKYLGLVQSYGKFSDWDAVSDEVVGQAANDVIRDYCEK